MFFSRARKRWTLFSLIEGLDTTVAGQAVDLIFRACDELGVSLPELAIQKRLPLFAKVLVVLTDNPLVDWSAVEREIGRLLGLFGLVAVPPEHLFRLEQLKHLSRCLAGRPMALEVGASLCLDAHEKLYWQGEAGLSRQSQGELSTDAGSPAALASCRANCFKVASGHAATDGKDRPVAEGMLYLTANRLVFEGERRVAVDLDGITGCAIDGRVVRVGVDGGSNTLVLRLDEPLLARVLGGMIGQLLRNSPAEGARVDFERPPLEAIYAARMKAAKSKALGKSVRLWLVALAIKITLVSAVKYFWHTFFG